MIPAAGNAPRSAPARIWFIIPRVLNDPACCRYSSLNHTVPVTASTGVRRIRPRMRRSATATSLAPITCPPYVALRDAPSGVYRVQRRIRPGATHQPGQIEQPVRETPLVVEPAAHLDAAVRRGLGAGG